MTAEERQRKKLQDKKIAAQERASKENITPIVAENKTTSKSNLLTTDDVIEGMLELIKKVDLIETLQNDLNDPLLKYSDEDGNISTFKVPMTLYIVGIIHEISKVAEKNSWQIAKEHDVIYLFNGIFWQRAEDSHIKAFLGKASVKLGYFSPAQAMTHNFVENTFKQFSQSAVVKRRDRNKDIVMINLLNGTLEVKGGDCKIKAHDAEDFLTYVLDFHYDPNAEAPLFHQYLNRVLPDISSRNVLQEYHGYIFIRHLKLEKALVLLGNGQNGKSVQFEITKSLLGDDNVSTKSLGDLVDRDAGNDNRAKLQDKLLNYGSEIRANVMDVDIFKRLVSGEPVSAREKYKTGFDLVNTCKFLFNANGMPKEIERTDAYFRRFIIIPYDQKITEAEKDPELHTKIIRDELPGVLNWVIDGLYRLLNQKKFTECDAANDALETYKRESNSVLLFIEEHEVTVGGGFVTNDVLYEAYKDFCLDSGHNKFSKINFSKEMVSAGFEADRKKVLGKTKRGFYADIA